MDRIAAELMRLAESIASDHYIRDLIEGEWETTLQVRNRTSPTEYLLHGWTSRFYHGSIDEIVAVEHEGRVHVIGTPKITLRKLPGGAPYRGMSMKRVAEKVLAALLKENGMERIKAGLRDSAVWFKGEDGAAWRCRDAYCKYEEGKITYVARSFEVMSSIQSDLTVKVAGGDVKMVRWDTVDVTQGDKGEATDEAQDAVSRILHRSGFASTWDKDYPWSKGIPANALVVDVSGPSANRTPYTELERAGIRRGENVSFSKPARTPAEAQKDLNRQIRSWISQDPMGNMTTGSGGLVRWVDEGLWSAFVTTFHSDT